MDNQELVQKKSSKDVLVRSSRNREVQGDYYHHEVVFDGGYTALIDVVVKDQQIQLVEFDERGPKTIILKNGQE